MVNLCVRDVTASMRDVEKKRESEKKRENNDVDRARPLYSSFWRTYLFPFYTVTVSLKLFSHTKGKAQVIQAVLLELAILLS